MGDPTVLSVDRAVTEYEAIVIHNPGVNDPRRPLIKGIDQGDLHTDQEMGYTSLEQLAGAPSMRKAAYGKRQFLKLGKDV